SLPEARHLGDYEVVFAVDSAESEERETATSGLVAKPPDRLSLEIADLKRELDGMRRTLALTAFAPTQAWGASTDAAGAYATLLPAEVAPELARELIEGAEARRSQPPGAAGQQPFESALAEEIESRIATQPEPGRGNGQPRLVAL